MGKDIDRNITRQLWERLKNTFSKNDVIPVKNGGTGTIYEASDYYIKNISLSGMHFIDGFKPQTNYDFYCAFNKKSVFMSGILSVKRTEGVTSNTFAYCNIEEYANYNINNIRIGIYGLSISIKNKKVFFSCNFTNNVISTSYRYVVPLV